jgi:peptide/nickel transport system permease protein
MPLYIVKRFFMMLPTLFGVVTLTFLLVHMVPGDPIEVLLGERALDADRASLERSLGLDLPITEQYVKFLGNLITLDLGNSFYSGKPVLDEVLKRFPATAYLAVMAIFMALVFAFPLGMWAASHKGKWQDKTALGFSMVAFSMPSFWLGPMLIIFFSIYLGVLPVSGDISVQTVILPALTLGMSMSAMTARLLRSSILESLGSDYIKTAKAKGVKMYALLWKHALRNALLPVITVVFLQAGVLLTGAILVEAVFSWPGIGTLIVDALQKRDYPMVQGCVLFIAFVYMLMTLTSDILYAWVDPRIRHGKEGDA